MASQDESLLSSLAMLGSATVQNAGVEVRGRIPAAQDYSGPGLQLMTPGVNPLAGYALTFEVAPYGAVTGGLQLDGICTMPSPPRTDPSSLCTRTSTTRRAGRR